MTDRESDIRLATRALARSEIAAHPLFFSIEVQIASHLIGIHARTPRLARLKASHRKWLLTQSMYALHMLRNPDDPLSGLTASRMIETMIEYGVASRNTATAFLAELVAYKFLRDVPGIPDRRVRVLETTEVSDQAMSSWFRGHMACLDRLDGGNREAATLADPRLFRLAQPRAAKTLIEDPAWREPPDSIGSFLWSESGGMLLHEIISRVTNFDLRDGRVVAPVGITELAQKYAISTTNVKRMFGRAETAGLLGWEQPRRKGNLWLGTPFVDDYFGWQSVKFAALDEAVHWAERQLI